MNGLKWEKGTDLRNSQGVYTWPPIETEPENPKEYVSCTTVLKEIFGVPDVAHANFVASEAQRLTALHAAGMMTKKSEVYLDEFGQQQRDMVEVAPFDLLMDDRYLRMFGFTQSGRAAHRGTVVHEFLRHWHLNGAMAPADVPYWVEDTIAEGDGELPYKCDVDETTAYTQELRDWLARTGFRLLATEIPGFHNGLGYAVTIDSVGVFPQDPRVWMMDVKTSLQSSRQHALQIVAQRHVEFLGIPGTDETTTFAGLVGDAPLHMAQLLVATDRTCFRECDAPFDWWVKTMDMYRIMRSEMPFQTVPAHTKRRGGKS